MGQPRQSREVTTDLLRRGQVATGKISDERYKFVDRPDIDVEGRRDVGYGRAHRSGRVLVLDFRRRFGSAAAESTPVPSRGGHRAKVFG